VYIFLRKCCEVFVCVSNLLCASMGSGKDIQWQVSGFKNQNMNINRNLEIFTFCWEFCNKTMILLWECCVTVQNTNKQWKKWKPGEKNILFVNNLLFYRFSCTLFEYHLVFCFVVTVAKVLNICDQACMVIM